MCRSLIDREEWVSAHDPKLSEIVPESPLTVGNGRLGFTADITGMQSLYKEYKEILPLCTLSGNGWHTKPAEGEQKKYTLDDLVMTEYISCGKTVRYPQRRVAGNGEVYDWLRQNPHRLNLARIGFCYEEKELQQEQISNISQELHLYTGVLDSHFMLNGDLCEVRTVCHQEENTLGFDVKSQAMKDGKLEVRIWFPYGSSDITASDWNSDEKHKTEIVDRTPSSLILRRKLDQNEYYVVIQVQSRVCIEQSGHEVRLIPQEDHLMFTVSFLDFAHEAVSSKELEMLETITYLQTEESSKNGWSSFWEKGGALRLRESKDPRAWELERRIVLSKYLMALNSAGDMPPQETGLTCNSWYGKAHLEMYLWHCAWLPLWHHTDLLERSLKWYLEILPQARENARRNGYAGARWPKMVGPEGIDCPSPIAPLLIWQQPHVIYMLELAWQQMESQKDNKEKECFQETYWPLVEESADFMVDFVEWKEEENCFELPSPVIPVQECHRADQTVNPAFELEYWNVGLHLACQWAERMGKVPEKREQWKYVADHMADMPEKDGLYLAHKNCPDTFERYNKDHPSMLGAFGLIDSKRTDKEKMRKTLHKVLECWDYQSLWGWDFAMMAMTAVRLNEPETAIDILLKDTMKNSYVASGNNMQRSRKDLPLYLPGNGSLLLAIPLMAMGWKGCKREHPGFPDNSQWIVEVENMDPYPA